MTALLRRALMRRGASLDPFTIMEVETLLAPALRGRGGAEAAVEYIASILAKSYVEDARRVAEEVVEEVLRECRRTGCGRG